MRLLRSVTLLALASCALASEAAVRYTFTSGSSAFSLTTGSPITTTTTFTASDFDSSGSNFGFGPFGSVTFDPDLLGMGLIASLQVHRNSFGAPASEIYFFNLGAFSTYGTHDPRGGGGAVLTVENVAPAAVPGPAAALPFALMALRRKRA